MSGFSSFVAAFIKKLQQEVLPIWFVTFLLGAAITLLARRVTKTIRTIRSRVTLRRNLEHLKLSAAQRLNIIDLDHADPEYKANRIIFERSDRQFHIPMPQHLVAKLRENFPELIGAYQPAISKSRFEQLAQELAIPEFRELVLTHGERIADEFWRRTGTPNVWFNGKMFGVYAVHFSRMPDQNEDNIVRIRLFETDYFTDRVMRSMYQELRDKGHAISHADSDNYLRWWPFLTSFGLNILIIVGEHGRECLVLGQRSKKVSYEDRNEWHVSMNEALTYQDLEHNGISMSIFLQRGLKEEMGLSSDDIEGRRVMLLDFFLTRNAFEIGLFGICKLPNLTLEQVVQKHSVARDSALETSELKMLPYTKAAIEDFIKTVGEDSFVRHGLYALEVILARNLP